MKKLLLLGSSRYIVPVIKAAHEMGCYVITCDYFPDGVAHKYSDEYRNVSIIDKEAVLKTAQELGVNGVMSFAADPGVTTAAYVAEKMNLPFNGSYDSVCILQNKVLFRKFLADNGFAVPLARGYKSIDMALSELDDFSLPIIVKPVDSAGSKGVTRVDDLLSFHRAAEVALSFSVLGEFIVEEFIEKEGCSSDADGFTVDGKFECVSFTDQLFDEQARNPYAPAAYIMPCSMDEGLQEGLIAELQRLAKLLRLRSGVYNIETRIGKDGKSYLMELSPRGGGNRLSELLRFSSGVDLVSNSVRAALGEELQGVVMPVFNGYWAEQMLHSDRAGRFIDVEFIPEFKRDYVHEIDLWINSGDYVDDFAGANNAFGSVIFRFESQSEMSTKMNHLGDYMKVLVE